MPEAVEVPTFKDLMWPTLRALDDLGGSGTIQEIVAKVLELGSYTEEQLQRLIGMVPTLRSSTASPGRVPT